MVDLSQTDVKNLTNTNDKEYNENETDKQELYQWAKLFKAHDWEEAMEVVKSSDAMKEVVVTLRELSEEEKIKLQCLGRIMYNGDMSSARSQGNEIGFQMGAEQERSLLNVLNQKLIEDKRFEDLQKSTTNYEFQRKLMAEYGIS